MSIYTVVERSQLEGWLQNFDIGTLVDFQGIEAGVENTNYFVTTTQGEYVLTLVESVSAEKLPFILGFVDHLSGQGVAVAQPVPDHRGALFGSLNQKPAVFMKRLAGKPLDKPNQTQCEAIGQTLAQSHMAASQLPVQACVNIGHWCQALAEKVLTRLNAEHHAQLNAAVISANEIPWHTLPSGPVHGDLFPDNALFAGDALAGLIDFYHACSTAYLYDLAVTLNAWCYDEEKGQYDKDKADALLSHYQQTRRLTEEERHWLPEMQKVAALRFWLSRLRDQLFPKEGEFVTVKDPEGKRRLLTLMGSQS